MTVTIQRTARSTYPPSQPLCPPLYLKVIPPIFSFLTINTWLLATCTFQPNPRYLRNPNLSKLRDAPIYIWNLPAGVRTRKSIKGAREDFIKSLYTATNQISTNAAANTFINKIGLWIMELQGYALA